MLIAGVKRSNRGNSVRKTDEGIVRRICDKLVPYEVLPDFMVLNKNDRKNARNPLSRRLPRHFAPFLSTANSIFWGAFSNQWRCHQKNVNKLYCSVQSQLQTGKSAQVSDWSKKHKRPIDVQKAILHNHTLHC